MGELINFPKNPEYILRDCSHLDYTDFTIRTTLKLPCPVCSPPTWVVPVEKPIFTVSVEDAIDKLKQLETREFGRRIRYVVGGLYSGCAAGKWEEIL